MFETYMYMYIINFDMINNVDNYSIFLNSIFYHPRSLHITTMKRCYSAL